MMRTVRENPVLFCLLLYLCAMAGMRYPALTILCISFIWALRTRDLSVILILIASLIVLIPRWNPNCTSMKEGTAVIVNGSYSILQHDRNRIIVYTEEPLQYDAVYEIHADIRKIHSSPSFFGFDSGSWLKGIGVSGSVPENRIHLVRNHRTFRFLLQQKIKGISDASLQSMLYKTLLNIRQKDTDRDSWIYDNGFSYAGILTVINQLLKGILDRRKRKKIMLILSMTLSILYGFPLLTVQSFIFNLLSMKDSDPYERTGIGLSIMIILYPLQVRSMSFLIPAIYRITSLCQENRKIIAFTLILAIQSLQLNMMNPIRSLCYGFMQKLCGLLWITGIFSLFLPEWLFLQIADTASVLDSFLDHFDLPGSMLSLTFPFFLLVVFLIRKNRKAPYIICTLMLFLQISGWNHPFGELTFVSVGQGDSILLRAPLNSTNILIDTGKSSAWNSVDAMLKAKGIRHLDGLIVTHGDNDHAGNKDRIIQYYRPEKIIETHRKKTGIGPFVLYDLNEIQSTDENASSVVDYISLNQMNVCLMGDADKSAEKKITDKYSGLHCDVLKLGHHGSKTSSSDEFLDTVRPHISIISSGAYTIYHHPSPETIQKLLKRHIPYFDTKEEGDITILFLPHGNLLVTSSGKIAIIPK